MENIQHQFIATEQFNLLQNLEQNTAAKWGVMNTQQMVEHVSDFFNISIEKIPVTLLTPEEHLPKYKEFLYSDKQFKENTKAPASLLGEEALPVRNESLAIAKEKLQQTVGNFIAYFENDPEKKTLHPVFGWLTFNEWIMLHHKHVTHHWRQFGLIG